MRIGRICNNYTDEGFKLVKDQNLEFIEICRNSEVDALDLVSKKDSVKALIEKWGIGISCVGRWNHDVMENGALVSERKASYFALLDTAIDLGAKTFVTGINYDSTVSLYKNYTAAIGFFGELIEHAKSRGSDIKIAIQNCNWNNWVTSPVHWDIILGELPELYIKYDASHAYNRGEDYLAQLSDYGERVAHVHIKGTTHAGKHTVDDPPAGMDDINWRSLFAILYARRYDGDLSIEPHSAVWQGELGAAGVEFTRKFIKEFMLK